jgi:XFP-like protein
MAELLDTERALMDAYWRAANYLSVGQIYLYDNPLLKQTLTKEHIKPRLLGHWGTTPGLNFIYVHLNRLIKKHDLDMIYITGPGHGGPGLVANAYLEGTYSEVYPNITPDEEGMKRLFTPRSDCSLRCRRRRGRDGTARDELAFQQIPEPGYRWNGSAGPAPQRLQDSQSLRLGSDQP